jgi:hypothetical protein
MSYKAVYHFTNGEKLELTDLSEDNIKTIKQVNSSTIITGDRYVINMKNVNYIEFVEVKHDS